MSVVTAIGRATKAGVRRAVAGPSKAELAKKEAARIDRQMAGQRAEMRKARATKLAAQQRKKKPPKPWYKKYNPFAVLTEAQKQRKK